jgi:cytosine/adenosine deaminase-related metal-dependent hydrolase
MRLGSGIAPIREMLRAGVNVGLGVDGSASNDSGHLMNEARQAMLLQRVAHGGDAMSARTALELATRGGAITLGREDLGSIEPGKRADFAAFSTAEPALSGAWDKVAGLLLAGPLQAWHTVVEGKYVVREGQIATINLPEVLAIHHKISVELMNG